MLTTPLFINNIGPMGLIVIALVFLVLFGRGKIASMMGEVGKGISSFKKGVSEGSKDDDDAQADPALSDSATARDITPDTDKDKV